MLVKTHVKNKSFFWVSRVERLSDSRSDRETGQELNTALSLICQWCQDWWYLSPVISTQTLQRHSLHFPDTERHTERDRKQACKPTQTDMRIPERTNRMDVENVYVFVWESEKERRGITPHFSSQKCSESIICFKYCSLINKSLAHIRSIQDSSSLVTINHNSTMRRFCSALNE